jgi:hypothetical protein
MRKGMGVALAIVVCIGLFVGACVAGAKEKKSTLPAYVLDAQTVLVMIDPDAGTSMADPGGNKTAQDDVEKALMKWGRLRPVLTMGEADLVIVIRKGNKQPVQPTVGGEPTNDRPVLVQGTDSSIRVGVQQGRSPDGVQNGGPVQQRPGMGAETGPTEDTFFVYQGQTFAGDAGRIPSTSERTPVWKYMAKNGLKSPEVPAVGEFKKAVDEAVKQQQAQQQKQQPQSKP